MTLIVPDRVTLIPDVCGAALRSDECYECAAWFIFRSALISAGDRGNLVNKTEALRLLSIARGIGLRHARIVLSRGEGRYWTFEAAKRGNASGEVRIRLVGAAVVAVRLGVLVAERAQTVPTLLLRGRGRTKATLYAAATHRLPDHAGTLRGRPLTRDGKRRITGISRKQQQRHDRSGATRFVEATYAEVNAYPSAPGGRFMTSGGRWMRRLGDVRLPEGHWQGSRSTALRIRREQRRLRATDTADRNPSPVPRRSASFQATTRADAWRKFMDSGAATGLIAYSEGRRRGRVRREIVERANTAWAADLTDADLTPSLLHQTGSEGSSPSHETPSAPRSGDRHAHAADSDWPDSTPEMGGVIRSSRDWSGR